jgi:hypothetical protein
MVVVVLLSSFRIGIKIGYDNFLPIISVTMFAINPEARCFVVRVTEVVVNKP